MKPKTKTRKRKTEKQKRLERAREIDQMCLPPGSKMLALGELGFGGWALRPDEIRRRKKEQAVQNKINRQFKGKTIKWVKVDGCNHWTFQFTDGTSAVVETELAVSTQHGDIHGLTVKPGMKSRPDQAPASSKNGKR